ncbi:MAG: lipopolysaccharide biosynthesis protein [Alphaproteobacteria bacterium]|nr:MAG: lipopolysaccharide biosynthesis protein [Alphaproteobacteria bacterium]
MTTILLKHWRLLIAGPIAAGLIALGISFQIAPTFTSRTTFLPPQQQQSAASAALSTLGALSGLAGAGGIKSPGEQFVSLLQSVNVEDRIVDRFKLMDVYNAKYRFLARNELEKNSRISLGKKDGLITVEVDAKNPTMAAEIANQYVVELRRLTAELALTESQQRRVFFESELKSTRNKLTDAQQALQSSGINPGALKTQPKEAAESYARTRAEAMAAEVRLQIMRRSLSENAVELQQQQALLAALRAQLTKQERAGDSPGDSDYIGRYREFKYQESLFELLARQYEAARMDESREANLIQVVDVAMPAEYKSKPKRALIVLGTLVGTALLMMIAIVAWHFWGAGKAQRRRLAKTVQATA